MSLPHAVDRSHARPFEHGTVFRVPIRIRHMTSLRPLFVLSTEADLVHNGWFTVGEVTQSAHPGFVPCGGRAGLSEASHLNPFDLRLIKWDPSYEKLVPTGSFDESVEAQDAFQLLRSRIAAFLSEEDAATLNHGLPGLPQRNGVLEPPKQPHLRIPWYKRGTVIEIPKWSDNRGYWLVLSSSYFNERDAVGRSAIVRLVPAAEVLSVAVAHAPVPGTLPLPGVGECLPVEERVATLNLTRFFSWHMKCNRPRDGGYHLRFQFGRQDSTCARCDGGDLEWPREVCILDSATIAPVAARVLAYLGCN